MNIKKILIATDGSKRAEKAAEHAIELAKSSGAELNIVSVVDEGSPRSAMDIDPYDIVDEDTHILDELDEEKSKPEKAVVNKVRKMAADAGIDAGGQVRIGDPANEILAYANETGSDVIVIGSHSRGNVANAVLGSTNNDLIHRGHVPVLVIPVHD